MEYRWLLRPVSSPDAVASVSRALNELPEPLARALVLRGIDTLDRARSFFRPSLDALHDPFLMADMDAAASRVVQALKHHDRVVVYGDYDVDGTTATALLVSSLRALGGDVSFFVPDRFDDGYGLSRSGIDSAAALGAELLITVDCGVTALDEARYVRDRGMDLVICDHHTPRPELPDAVAVLDPKRPDCPYPFEELSGCAVAFKLLQAILTRLDLPEASANAYLDLVAVSTASDIVPVRGENRILLNFGLEQIQAQPRLGIRALAAHGGTDLAACSARDVVFSIAPRLNAAGRLSSAKQAVELLMADEPARAGQLASDLDALNVKRREMDRDVLASAAQLAERHLTSRMRHAVVLHCDDWHLGVIGIVASRLVERFYRPTILLGTIDGVARGSARSIAGVNVYEILEECGDLLLEFGGHDYAAGMSLEITNVPAFQERFDAAVGAVITPELLEPAIDVDARLGLDEIDGRFWAVLKQFAPYGPTNDPPVFQSNGLQLARRGRTVGRDGSHLKLTVRRNGSKPMDAIGFGLGDRMEVLEKSWRAGRPVDLLYSLEENTWNGRTTLQLKARDVRLSRTASSAT